MPDAYTTTAALDFDQAAYDLATYYALRPELYFDAVADVQSTNQSLNGSSVVFTITNDLAVASTALNESVDVSAVALSAAISISAGGVCPDGVSGTMR